MRQDSTSVGPMAEPGTWKTEGQNLGGTSSNKLVVRTTFVVDGNTLGFCGQ